MKNLRFIDLHRHSEYSLLDGSIRIKDMVDNTEYAGALTDHGNMFGHLKYYKEMKKQGKIPIIGMEGYMKSINGEKNRNHVILLCKNKEGYKNLSRLTSKSYDKENFYYKPQITWEELEKHSDGLICLSACRGGELPKEIEKRKNGNPEAVLKKFLEIFGEDFYIEVQRHFTTDENYINNQLIKLAEKYGVKVVATTDAHYLNKEDAKVHEILLAMQTKKTLKDDKRFKFEGENYHMLGQDEMASIWYDHPEFLANTLEVLEKCKDFEIDLDKIYMPNVKLPQNFNNEKDYFKALIWEGCKEKGLTRDRKYIDRIKKELDIIDKMGFIGYFLIVQDFINYAKKHNIAVGPGRGCTVGETPIISEKGIFEIKDIAGGDYVYTHTGMLKRVKNTMTYPIDQESLLKFETCEVEGKGNAYTKDHKLYVAKNPKKPPEWIEAKDVVVGDYLIMPKIERPRKRWLDINGKRIENTRKNLQKLVKNRDYENTDVFEIIFGLNYYNIPFEIGLDNRITIVKDKKLYHIKKNYICKQVTKIEEVEANCVYDLTVEHDHSYLTTAFAAHNSAGGSLICYLLGITEIDPIKNDLIFERFLNPDRVSMPDIDVDFADVSRDEVISYVKDKYGEDNVSNIITFGTMGARMILRDVTRTLNKPYWLGDKLAKMVPERPKITLKEALEESPELTNFINGNSDAKEILEYSMKLEGLPRHASQHACFVAGTKVSTENGEKNIENIKVGDYVLTHKNRYKKVINVMKKRVKTLMSITPELYFRTITCTPDHPFLTCRVIDGNPLVQKLTEPVWKEAQDIDVEEDLLCIPLKNKKGIIGWWLDTKNILFTRDNDYSTDGCVWIRPRQICIEQLSYKEDVYNFTVEDDSSYVVNGIAVHNCGVIISSEKIQEIIPEAMVGPKNNKARVTQVTMTECEDLGLLKMDFLGLRTMTVIQKSLAEINRQTGKNIKPGDIPIYDRNIYTLIAQGKNEGLFQIESEGMVSFLRELFGDIWEGEVKGRELFDRLVAGISLYRPGPMEYIPDYIKGMRSPARVKYDHDKLRPILMKTYGQIVYQEQVMQIAVELAGYSMAQADNLRRAMGEFLPSQLVD